MFTQEKAFEEALIQALGNHGWEKTILKNFTEAELLQNWADILFENNRGRDELNDYPLTQGEMAQIIERITALRTPLKLNELINGKTILITRDHPEDLAHFGKPVELKIYDRLEIAGGKSRYQIAQQPRFKAKSAIQNDRRGDLILLINGMPVIHIELKRSGVSIKEATYQIEKYMHEGVFTGLFALTQIFVAMTPEDTLYFANPGPDGRFNSDYFFHWADFNNEPICAWDSIAESLLSIPMAHQLIGFYTVADESDGILKVMRSYQYYAANAISTKVAKTNWEGDARLGGFIWHTTGSGKTMTSFKSAQLIAVSKDADKVIFLMDRIELGTQSLKEYRGFANKEQDVQATENTSALIGRLKSTDPSDTLIVTSIQKMKNIKEKDGSFQLKSADLADINNKRLVFIVDECHRSTFGEMLQSIKQTFPRAIFFGFTGTPIQEENQKKHNTTASIFGDELHRYSIADGIRDKNVLGFDPYKVLTYQDEDLRQAVALAKAKAKTVTEALADPQKSDVYYRTYHLPMATTLDEKTGKEIKGIEDYLPTTQYQQLGHHTLVVEDILKNWQTLSHGGQFHAIFATASIPEAIDYYALFKEKAPQLKVTALFDPTIDNNGGYQQKETCLCQIIGDYNARYGTHFSLPNFAIMKKDIALRLAHKNAYLHTTSHEKEIDLLIVVDQMLTGFDSKWVNTLYLDKLLQYENIIQAFSRTNRLFGPTKPFGTIKYYRKPHTMEKRVAAAVKLYAGNKPLALFVNRLNENLQGINTKFQAIETLFKKANIENFKQLPPEPEAQKKFSKLFREFNSFVTAASIQGFTWQQTLYNFPATAEVITVIPTLHTYTILIARQQELRSGESGGDEKESIPYDVQGTLSIHETDDIDADYMQSHFAKYLKQLHGEDREAREQALKDLHSSFAELSQQEQKFAVQILNDIGSGKLIPEEGKTFRLYLYEYMAAKENDQIKAFAACIGVDEAHLRAFMSAGRKNAETLNEFGRFDELKQTVDKAIAKSFFEKKLGVSLRPREIPIKIDTLLREFILSGGFDVESYPLN